jgi:hypothetical protein
MEDLFRLKHSFRLLSNTCNKICLCNSIANTVILVLFCPFGSCMYMKGLFLRALRVISLYKNHVRYRKNLEECNVYITFGNAKLTFMKQNPFPYSYWTKILGGLLVIIGFISFFTQHHKKGVYDLNELAIGLSWGFVFIFFSKEKSDDEMIRSLKFKALAVAVIVAFSITHLYNFLFLNWRLKRENDVILSISAYQFLALTLIIATGYFYYLKHQATLNDNE